MRWILMLTTVGGLAMSEAVARNVINEHGPYTENAEFTIDRDVYGNDVGVRIRKDSAWSQIWKFEAYDSQTGSPGYINYIRIDPSGDVGYIRLRIVGAPGHQYGAQDVKQIDLLTNADNSTEVYSVYISGNLGGIDAIEADGIGGVYAGGSLLHPLRAQDDITGDVMIDGNLEGWIVADSAQNITVNGAGPHTGNIAIGGNYGATLNIKNDFSGDASIVGNLTGIIDLQGQLLPGARIHITGNVIDSGSNLIGIKYMAGGEFSCHDMNLNDPTQPWSKGLQIGWGVAEGDYWQTTHTGSITVSGVLRGALFIGGCSALALDIGSMAGTNPEPRIHATYRYLNGSSILVRGDVSNGRIRIGDRAGDFGSGPAMAGTITVQGSVASAAQIDTLNPLTEGMQTPAPIEANVTIDGNLNGMIHSSGSLSGAVDVGGTLNGEIRVEGSLPNTAAENEIHMGAKGSAGAVAINWDGYHRDPNSWDDWVYGAQVQVGTQEPYLGNTPDQHIWNVTCIKGEMNNDGVLDAFDIDAFILALTSPAGYATAYVGLSGSMLYHSDCDCSGALDAFDIDAFVLRLTNSTAWHQQYDCEECPPPADGPGAGDGGAPGDDLGSPAAVAALLRDNVAPERLSVVIEIAAELASAYGDTPRGEFWTAVLAELE